MPNEIIIPADAFGERFYSSYSDYARKGRTLKDYAGVNITEESLDFVPNKNENVHSPSHYTTGQVEVIDLLEDIAERYDDPKIAYLVSTAAKYIYRSPFKNNQKEDLEKAVWYLQRAISHL